MNYAVKFYGEKEVKPKGVPANYPVDYLRIGLATEYLDWTVMSEEEFRKLMSDNKGGFDTFERGTKVAPEPAVDRAPREIEIRLAAIEKALEGK